MKQYKRNFGNKIFAVEVYVRKDSITCTYYIAMKYSMNTFIKCHSKEVYENDFLRSTFLTSVWLQDLEHIKNVLSVCKTTLISLEHIL